MIAIFRQLIYEKHFVGVPHFETNEYKKFISPSLSSFFQLLETFRHTKWYTTKKGSLFKSRTMSLFNNPFK